MTERDTQEQPDELGAGPLPDADIASEGGQRGVPAEEEPTQVPDIDLPESPTQPPTQSPPLEEPEAP